MNLSQELLEAQYTAYKEWQAKGMSREKIMAVQAYSLISIGLERGRSRAEIQEVTATVFLHINRALDGLPPAQVP